VNRREKNLMFLLLACEALFVVILYSPIGSPNDYLQSPYFAKNQGVTFSGRIINSSKTKNFAGNRSQSGMISMNGLGSSVNFKENPSISIDDKNIDVTMPEYNSMKKNTAKYAVANTNTSSEYNNGNTSYAVSAKSNIISNQNTGVSSGGGGIANVGAAIIGKTTSDNNNPNPLPTGFTALNIDLSVFNDLTTPKTSVGYTAGATDPGEDNLVGPPIPVPDGFWLLLIMALGYTGFKFIKRKKLDPQV
jgi:hypothetical protein